jgi:anti-sigma B factor antagonist
MIAKTETLGGCKILRVSGRIDFESALDFEHHINAMIQESAAGYIIELSQVELLSSAGLRVMLSTAKRVAHRNGSLALAAPSQVVRQVFEISHFNLLFKIFPSVPAAMAAFKDATEVVQTEESAQDSPPPSDPMGREKTRSSDSIVPSLEPVAKQPPLTAEATHTEPLPSVLKASAIPGAESPTVTPPTLPPTLPRSAQESETTSGRKESPTQPARQTPPPLPPSRAVPISTTMVRPPAARRPDPITRREAKSPALLEVRAEGASYPCKDGDVIGTDGRLAQTYFSQISNLAPRHLLIGKLEGHWFVFTPKNVQHPFVLDGVVLRAGERKILQYEEHQVEFSGYVFGFRLVAQPQKKGFFSRIFSPKR